MSPLVLVFVCYACGGKSRLPFYQEWVWCKSVAGVVVGLARCVGSSSSSVSHGCALSTKPWTEDVGTLKNVVGRMIRTVRLPHLTHPSPALDATLGTLAAFCRTSISLYAVVANLYLHCGLAFLPVLLAKGVYRIADYADGWGILSLVANRCPACFFFLFVVHNR